MVKKRPTPSPARVAQNKRIAAVYFLSLDELKKVKRAAKKKGMSFAAFMREAALREATKSQAA